ncbi:MAG: C39 family peptidase [Eubacterium sp.]|nr:C39 family peptidase [Eubacterium sp.]
MRKIPTQREIDGRRRHSRGRRSRLAAQNAAMEKQRKRGSRILLLIALGALIAGSGPFVKAVRNYLGSTGSAASQTSQIPTGSTHSTQPSPDTGAAALSSSNGTSADSMSTEAVSAVSSSGKEKMEAVDYHVMLDTAMGPMLYYNQTDPDWGNYLWGGTDPLSTYGCGPTVIAMIANAFGETGEQITPVSMAQWAYDHKEFSPGNGSYHSLIYDALTSYGFTVTSMQDNCTADAISNVLSSGNLIVVLMGPGTFTDDGHFMILRSINPDGTVNIADPNSLDNTMKPFTPDQIISELHSARDNGAPIWSIAR